MLIKVISGGQTGADQAGVEAAKRAGLDYGGTMPRGFLTLDGLRPDFATLYKMQEHSSDKYPPRTTQNVRESDGTVRFAVDWNSYGERRTLAEIRKKHKRSGLSEQHYIDVDVLDPIEPAEVASWVREHNIRVLNVAGNSERSAPGIFEAVVEYLLEVFRILRVGKFAEKSDAE